MRKDGHPTARDSKICERSSNSLTVDRVPPRFLSQLVGPRWPLDDPRMVVCAVTLKT